MQDREGKGWSWIYPLYNEAVPFDTVMRVIDLDGKTSRFVFIIEQNTLFFHGAGIWRSITERDAEYDFASAGGSVNGQLVEADGLETAVEPLNLLGENCSMPSFGLAAAGRVSVDVDPQVWFECARDAALVSARMMSLIQTHTFPIILDALDALGDATGLEAESIGLFKRHTVLLDAILTGQKLLARDLDAATSLVTELGVDPQNFPMIVWLPALLRDVITAANGGATFETRLANSFRHLDGTLRYPPDVNSGGDVTVPPSSFDSVQQRYREANQSGPNCGSRFVRHPSCFGNEPAGGSSSQDERNPSCDSWICGSEKHMYLCGYEECCDDKPECVRPETGGCACGW